MTRHWIGPAAAVAIIAGCSSGGQPPASGAPQVGTVVKNQELYAPGVTYDLTAVQDKNVLVAPILAPSDSVWKVLPGVFIELGVDPGTLDQRDHVIANTSFVARHTLGDSRVSKYADCGSVMGAKTADQATVTLSLIVQVVADSGDISKLRTQFGGFATMDGAVANRITCTSTGAIEARIARMVNDELAHRTKH
jgi:hypothetical protein